MTERLLWNAHVLIRTGQRSPRFLRYCNRWAMLSSRSKNKSGWSSTADNMIVPKKWQVRLHERRK